MQISLFFFEHVSYLSGSIHEGSKSLWIHCVLKSHIAFLCFSIFVSWFQFRLYKYKSTIRVSVYSKLLFLVVIIINNVFQEFYPGNDFILVELIRNVFSVLKKMLLLVPFLLIFNHFYASVYPFINPSLAEARGDRLDVVDYNQVTYNYLSDTILILVSWDIFPMSLRHKWGFMHHIRCWTRL